MKRIGDGQLVETASEAEVIIRRLLDPKTKEVVYDCETSGLDPRVNFLVGHVFTFGPTPEDNYYVPVRHGDPSPSGNITGSISKFHKALAKAAAQRRDLHWIGHYTMFDLRFLWTIGVEPIGSFEDTAVNMALINEFSRDFSLAAACRALGVQEKKGEELYHYLASKFGGEPDKKQMQHYWKLSGDDPIAVDYALGDGISTWFLREAQVDRLADQDLDHIRVTESRITRVLYRMFKRGVSIDWAGLDKLQTDVDNLLVKAKKELPDDFNVLSPKQMRALMEKHGHTNWPHTPKGAPSFKEEWLQTNPIGRHVLTVRKYGNLGSTFIRPLQEQHRWKDGQIRCEYWQMASDDYGTVTGRFSCSAPNLQQVPKRNFELGSLFRRVFIPRDGSRWLSADMSQCEPRLLAHYSEAKALLEGFLAVPFVDAHSAVTISAGLEEMLGVPFKEAREYGKRLNQSLITGAGQAKIIEMLGGERGADVYKAYFVAMPEIKTLQKLASNIMVQKGYVNSLLGRRARLESRDKSYKGVNRLLQVSNADLIKQSMADMDDYFESERDIVFMTNTVHDSIDLDVPEGAEAIAERGLEFMCQYGPGRRFEMMVPMAIEYRFGANWSEATYGKNEIMMGADPNEARFLVSA